METLTLLLPASAFFAATFVLIFNADFLWPSPSPRMLQYNSYSYVQHVRFRLQHITFRGQDFEVFVFFIFIADRHNTETKQNNMNVRQTKYQMSDYSTNRLTNPTTKRPTDRHTDLMEPRTLLWQYQLKTNLSFRRMLQQMLFSLQVGNRRNIEREEFRPLCFIVITPSDYASCYCVKKRLKKAKFLCFTRQTSVCN